MALDMVNLQTTDLNVNPLLNKTSVGDNQADLPMDEGNDLVARSDLATTADSGPPPLISLLDNSQVPDPQSSSGHMSGCNVTPPAPTLATSTSRGVLRSKNTLSRITSLDIQTVNEGIELWHYALCKTNDLLDRTVEALDELIGDPDPRYRLHAAKLAIDAVNSVREAAKDHVTVIDLMNSVKKDATTHLDHLSSNLPPLEQEVRLPGVNSLNKLSFFITVTANERLEEPVYSIFSSVTTDLGLQVTKLIKSHSSATIYLRKNWMVQKAIDKLNESNWKGRSLKHLLTIVSMHHSSYTLRSGRIPRSDVEQWFVAGKIDNEVAIASLLDSNPSYFEKEPDMILDIKVNTDSAAALDRPYVTFVLHVTKNVYLNLLAQPEDETTLCVYGVPYRVYEDIQLKICWRCIRFDHENLRPNMCSQPERCRLCIGSHGTRLCPNKDDLTKRQCVNCDTQNRLIDDANSHLEIPNWSRQDINHSATAGICPYKRFFTDRARKELKQMAAKELSLLT